MYIRVAAWLNSARLEVAAHTAHETRNTYSNLLVINTALLAMCLNEGSAALLGLGSAKDIK